MPRPALQGIRINLSGSVPEGSTSAESTGIESFVSSFAAAVFSEGGTLVHGSHPTLEKPLEAAARTYVNAGGSKDALTLVRAHRYATTADQLAEIERAREYAVVQVIPGASGAAAGAESLVPMREWMAERCDVVVAVGGKHYQVAKALAGVPRELEEMLLRGKAGFAMGGFGGAVAGYLEDHEEVYGRLRNGLPPSENRLLAKSADVPELVKRIISQIKQLPLVRESVPRGRLFRILALDGGGLRGAFTAAVLAKWDDMLKEGGDNELVKHFDLVAGTSTGAILAIGLGLGLTPLQMLTFYKDEGPKIFLAHRGIRHWLKSKHESHTLRSILAGVLGERKLSESCCRLVIPTVRAIHGESEAITTAHSPDRKSFSSTCAVDAALASAAAPTYFDEAVVGGPISDASYLDGGIWANNPVLPAIAEAVRYLKVPIDRIDVLSVGTMGNEADFAAALGDGKLGWAAASTDLFFAAQEHAAQTLASSFLSPARHLRVNQQTPTAIALDDVGAIKDMAYRGSNVGQDSFADVRSRFLDGVHAPDWRTEMP